MGAKSGQDTSQKQRKNWMRPFAHGREDGFQR